jgi:hypothetical protein
MRRAITFFNIACLSLLTIAPLGVGCGGGTSGTSSTGELKLAGSAKDSSGAPLGNTPMLVRSASDDQELLSSETDARGDFGMLLPGDQSSVLVQIDGKQSQPITRAFTGSSVVSTILERADSGDLTTPGGFEVQIDPESLCSSVGTENNELFIQGDLTPSCLVKLMLSSSDYPLSTFSGVLRSRCRGGRVATATSSPDSQSVISVDLWSAAEQGCSPYEIQVGSSQDPSRVVVIPIR